ncbi:hypothetical protein GO491_11920 [Flavobacteriaceae bacterium Ap0902]|nr:hypothetical protein [Flavobacteriaceae bacterium Ap0902]
MAISKINNGFQFEWSDENFDYQVDVTYDNEVFATKVSNNHITTPFIPSNKLRKYLISLKNQRVKKAEYLRKFIDALKTLEETKDSLISLYKGKFDAEINGEDDVLSHIEKLENMDFQITELQTIYVEQFAETQENEVKFIAQ